MDLNQLLKEGYNIASELMREKQQIVVLLGFTGSGKSTLSKFLRMDGTLKIQENAQGFPVFVDDEVSIGSENSQTSKTFYPNIEKDKETQVFFVDCAGFEDTRNASMDLVVGFLNKLILDSAKEVKLVLVENFSKLLLNQDRSAFLKALEHMATLLKYNHQSLAKSICLVATKAEWFHKTDEELRKMLKTGLESTLKHLHEKKSSSVEEEIVKYLLKGDRYAFFRCPDKVGIPWQLDVIKENHRDIRNMIFKGLNFASNIKEKFNVTVAPETVNSIRDEFIEDSMKVSGRILDETATALKSEFDQKYEATAPVQMLQFCDNFLAYLSRIEDINQIESAALDCGVKSASLEEIKFQLVKIRFLHDVTGKDSSLVEKQLASLNGGKQKLIEHVKECRSRFVSKTKKQFSDNVDKLEKAIVFTFNQKYSNNDDEAVVVVYCKTFSDELAAVTSAEKMLKFSKAHQIDSKLLSDLEVAMNSLRPDVEDFDAACKNLATLNSGLKSILLHIQNVTRDAISSTEEQLTNNTNLLANELKIKFDLGALGQGDNMIQYCRGFIREMSAIKTIDDLLKHARAKGVGTELVSTIEKQLANLKLDPRGKKFQQSKAKLLELYNSMQLVISHVQTTLSQHEALVKEKEFEQKIKRQEEEQRRATEELREKQEQLAEEFNAQNRENVERLMQLQEERLQEEKERSRKELERELESQKLQHELEMERERVRKLEEQARSGGDGSCAIL